MNLFLRFCYKASDDTEGMIQCKCKEITQQAECGEEEKCYKF